MALAGKPSGSRQVDVQAEWAKAGGSPDYPMTVARGGHAVRREKPEALKAIMDAYRASVEWTVAHSQGGCRLGEKHELGLKAAVARGGHSRSAYVFIPADEARKDLETLFSVFLSYAPASIGGRLPDARSTGRVISLKTGGLVPGLDGTGRAGRCRRLGGRRRYSWGSELILPGPLPGGPAAGGPCSPPRFPQPSLPACSGYGRFLLAFPAALLIGVPAGLDSRFRAFVRPTFSVIGRHAGPVHHPHRPAVVRSGPGPDIHFLSHGSFRCSPAT
jgi:hypothetical protein